MMDYTTARNMPPIDTGDPQALEKVRERVDAYREEYERRKAVNAFYKQLGTLKGCPHTTPEEAAELMANLEPSCKGNPIPFGKKSMDSILGSIRSFEKRIAALERWREERPEGWRFDGGEVVVDIDTSRVKVFFDTRADIDTLINLKINGFVWEPREGEHGAWQKAISDRSLEAARMIVPAIKN